MSITTKTAHVSFRYPCSWLRPSGIKHRKKILNEFRQSCAKEIRERLSIPRLPPLRKKMIDTLKRDFSHAFQVRPMTNIDDSFGEYEYSVKMDGISFAGSEVGDEVNWSSSMKSFDDAWREYFMFMMFLAARGNTFFLDGRKLPVFEKSPTFKEICLPAFSTYEELLINLKMRNWTTR